MAFYNWNTGRNNASVETFQKILDVLDVQISDLVDQNELFTEDEQQKDDRSEKIVSIIDTLIEALEDIKGELCGAK